MTAVQDMTVAAKLSKIYERLIMPIDGGFRIKETPTHYIDVQRMIFNWRLCTCPKDAPFSYDGGWCYFGCGVDTLLRVVQAAIDWDGAEGTAPAGWNKDVFTGAYRG